MIEKIELKKVASYDDPGTIINDIKKINFIYGNNGTGKTTISELIRKEENFPSCKIHWRNNKIATYVYNKKFVEENFQLDSPIKGIFTLGKESVDIQKKINKLKSDIDKHDQEIVDLKDKHQIKLEEKDNIYKTFCDNSWVLKVKFDSEYKILIEGYRGSRQRFADKCIKEAAVINRELQSTDYIRAKQESTFNRLVVKIETINEIYFDNEFDDAQILNVKIIGKEDIDLARMINDLDISDWVKQGHEILKKDTKNCPFCQQHLPNEFIEKLNSYFDKTYILQINELNNFCSDYLIVTSKIVDRLKGIIEITNHAYVNTEKLEHLLKVIEANLAENKLLLDTKKKEPSRIIQLVNLNESIYLVNEEIKNANIKITEYNNIADNLKNEKENLVADMWRMIAEENKTNYAAYQSGMTIINKILESLYETMKKKEEYKKKFQDELSNLQGETTSIIHSVNEINRLLKSFGFKNFQLVPVEDGHYKIVRNSGDEAKDTLSEGEKTFITFLYFLQLLKGSNKKDDTTVQKVVVIDDPISSLDSNVLFMVSSLIRQLLFDIHKGNSEIKQIFILTHNIYFHKEVSFQKGKKSFGNPGYWITRKKDGVTFVTSYDKNPVNNSYELLWKELKKRNDQSLISMQNVMRHILENYFKFFGNIDIDSLEDGFELEDKPRCRSLISWVNDGSHTISEDLFVENNDDVTERYFNVFKDIFKIHGHIGHFNMMMGIVGETNEDMDNSEIIVPEGVELSFKEVAGGVE